METSVIENGTPIVLTLTDLPFPRCSEHGALRRMKGRVSERQPYRREFSDRRLKESSTALSIVARCPFFSLLFFGQARLICREQIRAAKVSRHQARRTGMYKYCERHDSMDGGGSATQGTVAEEPLAVKRQTMNRRTNQEWQ